jgi:hypothetical protein
MKQGGFPPTDYIDNKIKAKSCTKTLKTKKKKEETQTDHGKFSSHWVIKIAWCLFALRITRANSALKMALQC